VNSLKDGAGSGFPSFRVLFRHSPEKLRNPQEKYQPGRVGVHHPKYKPDAVQLTCSETIQIGIQYKSGGTEERMNELQREQCNESQRKQ
jgi:hypothetical protein